MGQQPPPTSYLAALVARPPKYGLIPVEVLAHPVPPKASLRANPSASHTICRCSLFGRSWE